MDKIFDRPHFVHAGSLPSPTDFNVVALPWSGHFAYRIFCPMPRALQSNIEMWGVGVGLMIQNCVHSHILSNYRSNSIDTCRHLKARMQNPRRLLRTQSKMCQRMRRPLTFTTETMTSSWKAHQLASTFRPQLITSLVASEG